MVTNPAIDREREVELLLLPGRVRLTAGHHGIPEEAGTIETAFPVLLGGHDGLAPLSDQSYREVAREHKTFLLEDLWEAFRGRAKVLDLSCLESETTQGAIERLKHEATTAVRDGCELLVLSDRTVYEGDRRYLDPHLALAAVDLALREHRASGGRPTCAAAAASSCARRPSATSMT